MFRIRWLIKRVSEKKPKNRCYNLQFAFCDELKAYLTGFVRSGNAYTANGAAEMIKEIIAHVKMDDLKILLRMDSSYFDEEIIATIKSARCQYLTKGKEYPTLASQVTDPSISLMKGDEGRETTELITKLGTRDKDRRFVVSHVLKPKKDSVQLSFLEGDEFEYYYFATNTETYKKSRNLLRLFCVIVLVYSSSNICCDR